MQQLHPGSVAVGSTARGLLIGEASLPAPVAPIGAGGIASIGTRQLSANGGSQGRFQRAGADANPNLEMARAGLQHDAGFMALGTHCLQDVGIGAIRIDQDVAGVAAGGVRMDVDVKALTVAGARNLMVDSAVNRLAVHRRSPAQHRPVPE